MTVTRWASPATTVTSRPTASTPRLHRTPVSACRAMMVTVAAPARGRAQRLSSFHARSTARYEASTSVQPFSGAIPLHLLRFTSIFLHCWPILLHFPLFFSPLSLQVGCILLCVFPLRSITEVVCAERCDDEPRCISFGAFCLILHPLPVCFYLILPHFTSCFGRLRAERGRHEALLPRKRHCGTARRALHPSF